MSEVFLFFFFEIMITVLNQAFSEGLRLCDEKKNEQPTRLTELDLAWGWCSWADSVCVCISPLVKEQEDGEDLFCTLVRRVDVFMIT